MNRKQWLPNFIVPIAIYLIALGIAIGFSLSVDYTATSDAAEEYAIYMNIVETERWSPIPDHTISSSITIVGIPAVVSILLNTDPLLTYKISHSIMVSFLPVVVYFLAKKYVKWQYACISTGLLLAHPYSMWEPTMVRTGVGIMFFALILIITLSNRLKALPKILLLAISSVGLVMSHYGTAYSSLFILGVSWAIIMCLHFAKVASFRHKMALTSALLLLFLASRIWLGAVTYTPESYARGFVANSMSSKQFTAQQSESIDKTTTTSSSFFNLDSRDVVVQAAFGRTLATANIPQKAEFVFSWLVVLTLTYGLFIAIKKRMFSKELLVLASVSYFTILLTMALPHISNCYGTVRVYFQSLVVLGICFTIGGVDLSRRLRLKLASVPLVVLVGYTLCTSNILHQFFGVSRWR